MDEKPSLEGSIGASWGERTHSSGRGLFVPFEKTQCPECVPSAWPVIALLQLKVDLAGMRILPEPGAIGLHLGSEQIDRFLHTRVRLRPDRAEVFQGAQYVVVPAGGK